MKALWDSLNNRQKMSINLLANGDVEVLEVEGQRIVLVKIPRASRKQRPVFLNGNPLTGTFRRNHEGDYHCQEEEVRRTLAEQVEGSAMRASSRDTRSGISMRRRSRSTARTSRRQSPTIPGTASMTRSSYASSAAGGATERAEARA